MNEGNAFRNAEFLAAVENSSEDDVDVDAETDDDDDPDTSDNTEAGDAGEEFNDGNQPTLN